MDGRPPDVRLRADHSAVPGALFNAGKMLKDAALVAWATLSVEQKQALRGGLLDLVAAQLHGHVRRTALTVTARHAV